MPFIGMCTISTVNLAEVRTRLYDAGISEANSGQLVDRFAMAIVPFDEGQAMDAARLRLLTREFGLSLGDRACLALAALLDLPVLTADRQWSKFECGVDIRLIR